MYRQPIITIMGHIDSGKTTFLDKVKGSAIVSKEAGKITQHIGATEITIDIITKFCGHLAKKFNFEINIPGLLFIDTPGHNAFDNLRERGGSLADLVVLVVDINKGLQAQDIETLNILKMYKVPFIIAANKIDLMPGSWQQESFDITSNLNTQPKKLLDTLDEKIYKIVGQLYDKGYLAERYDRVTDFTKTVAIIPTSILKYWGLPECVLFLSVLSQRFLGKKITLDPTDKMQAAVLEVGDLKGLGTTADIIVYQGQLKLKDSVVFPTKSGIKETKIKSILKPNVMSAIDKKSPYVLASEVYAASGVKIIANGLEECLPGGLIVSSEDQEAVEHLKNRAYSCFAKGEQGAFIKADTLGSLEALQNLLTKNGICIAHSDIGSFTGKDLLELKILNNKDKDQGVLFLFNVKMDKDFEEELIKSKIPIFKNNIIYKLIEDYQDWITKQKKSENEKLLKEIIYPCKFKVLPNCIFRASKPAVVGVKILQGRLVANANIEFNGKVIGKIEHIQSQGSQIEKAIVDDEVAISIKDASYLKDFKEGDVLEIYISKTVIEKLEKIIDTELTNEEIFLLNEIKQRKKEEEN